MGIYHIHTTHIHQYNYSSHLRDDLCSLFGHVNLITRVFTDISQNDINTVLSSLPICPIHFEPFICDSQAHTNNQNAFMLALDASMPGGAVQ